MPHVKTIYTPIEGDAIRIGKRKAYFASVNHYNGGYTSYGIRYSIEPWSENRKHRLDADFITDHDNFRYFPEREQWEYQSPNKRDIFEEACPICRKEHASVEETIPCDECEAMGIEEATEHYAKLFKQQEELLEEARIQEEKETLVQLKKKYPNL